MKKVLLFTGVVSLCLLGCSVPSVKTVYKAKTNQQTSSSYVVLNPDQSLDSQITRPNCTYEVPYGFDLEGRDLVLPQSVDLKFTGGQIYNGNVVFNDTYLEGFVRFSKCTYSGKIATGEVNLSWFDFEDGKTRLVVLGNTRYTLKTHSAAVLESIINACDGGTVIVDQLFVTTKAINITGTVTLKGLDSNEGIYATRSQNAEYGFINENTSAFIAKPGSKVSMYGITVLGYMSLYISGNIWEKEYGNGTHLASPYSLCGLELEQGATAVKIHDSTFTAWTYGIRSNGGTIGEVKNTYFSSCRFGFYADGTSNFTCLGCRFNTNLLNFRFHERNLDNYVDEHVRLTKTDGDQIRKIGAGLYLKNCSNVKIKECRFEFNFIHATLDETNRNIDIEKCIFDTGTIAQVMIYNANAARNTVTVFPKPSYSNINITGNTFARGARCDFSDQTGKTSYPGFGIFYIVEGDNRGSTINITDNIVSDQMEVEKGRNVKYEESIFCIHNTSTTSKLISTGNSFNSAKAENVYDVVSGSSGTYTITAQNNNNGSLNLTSGTTSVLNFN